jgi:HAMP domain-containing protein
MTNNWFLDYHLALQFRLLGLVVIFGVVCPALCALVGAGRLLARLIARRVEAGSLPLGDHDTTPLGTR